MDVIYIDMVVLLAAVSSVIDTSRRQLMQKLTVLKASHHCKLFKLFS
jgi:hypothetical protein